MFDLLLPFLPLQTSRPAFPDELRNNANDSIRQGARNLSAASARYRRPDLAFVAGAGMGAVSCRRPWRAELAYVRALESVRFRSIAEIQTEKLQFLRLQPIARPVNPRDEGEAARADTHDQLRHVGDYRRGERRQRALSLFCSDSTKPIPVIAITPRLNQKPIG